MNTPLPANNGTRLDALRHDTMPEPPQDQRSDELARETSRRKQAEAAREKAEAELERRVRARAEELETARGARPSSAAGRWMALKIAIAYALLGALWILLSDELLEVLAGDPVRANRLQTYKGWFFVLATALLLAWGLERYLRQIRRAEKNLGESEERFRILVSGVRDYAISLLDPEGRVTTWNSGAQQITLYREHEIIGKHFSCFFPPEEIRGGWPDRALEQAVLDGRFTEEGRIVRKDGKPLWARITITPLRDESGRLRGFANVTHDITARKLAHDDLRRANRALQVLGRCNEALLTVASETELLEEICRMVVADCGYRMAWVGFAENDEAKTVRPVAKAGFEDGYLETVNISWADTERGRGPVGRCIRTGQHFVVQSIASETEFAPWQSEATRRGYGSMLAVPLVAGRTTFGALAIYGAEPDVFGAEEVSLLVELAGNLALGLETLRARTARERATEALRASETKLQALLDYSPVGVALTLEDGNLEYVNRKFTEMFGYVREDVPTEEIWFQRVYPDPALRATVVPRWTELVRAASRDGTAIPSREATLVCKDGSSRHVQVNGAVVNRRLMVMMVDLTERRRAEERLQVLSRRLVELQEAERRHLARELHDEIGQGLTAFKMNLQALQSASEPASQRQLAQDAVGFVDHLLEQVRGLSLDLRPPMLDDLGLPAALRWLVDQEGRHGGFRTHLVVDPEMERLGPAVETACFRVIQEALTNVTRHARARDVEVEVERRTDEVRLRVRDDGRGFDPTTAREAAERGGSLGLLAMEERVTLLGGNIHWQSAPGQGTELTARLPLTGSDQRGH